MSDDKFTYEVGDLKTVREGTGPTIRELLKRGEDDGLRECLGGCRRLDHTRSASDSSIS
jgi:hypothetical protein